MGVITGDGRSSYLVATVDGVRTGMGNESSEGAWARFDAIS